MSCRKTNRTIGIQWCFLLILLLPGLSAVSQSKSKVELGFNFANTDVGHLQSTYARKIFIGFGFSQPLGHRMEFSHSILYSEKGNVGETALYLDWVPRVKYDVNDQFGPYIGFNFGFLLNNIFGFGNQEIVNERSIDYGPLFGLEFLLVDRLWLRMHYNIGLLELSALTFSHNTFYNRSFQVGLALAL